MSYEYSEIYAQRHSSGEYVRTRSTCTSKHDLKSNFLTSETTGISISLSSDFSQKFVHGHSYVEKIASDHDKTYLRVCLTDIATTIDSVTRQNVNQF